MDVITLVSDKVNELTEGSALFLIEVKMKPTNNIKVFLDGDEGLNVLACSKINRALYKMIEEAELYPDGDFSLEVSSAGVDEPLKSMRQYIKNIGRTLQVSTLDEQIHLGVLRRASETEIMIEKTLPKGKGTVEEIIPFENVAKAVVQIVF